MVTRMNIFELFSLPVSLKVNQAEVLKTYYALCRQYHPDQFTLSGENEQAQAEQMTAQVNQAKQILDDPHKRLEYLLHEANQLPNDEKYALSPLFLAEMMDINEALMDLDVEEDKPKKDQIHQAVLQQQEALLKTVRHYFEADVFSPSADDYASLKDYYYKRKYLQRILDKL